jgi:hypothetical protein
LQAEPWELRLEARNTTGAGQAVGIADAETQDSCGCGTFGRAGRAAVEGRAGAGARYVILLVGEEDACAHELLP